MPPSEIDKIPSFFIVSEQSNIADNWGYPIPVMEEVVHTEPEPIPIFTASTPASAKSFTPSPVTILPANIPSFGSSFRISLMSL